MVEKIAAENKKNQRPPSPRPTPQTTVEAIMWCVRERGIAALEDSKNQQRLSECDEAARAEINERVAKLYGAKP